MEMEKLCQTRKTQFDERLSEYTFIVFEGCFELIDDLFCVLNSSDTRRRNVKHVSSVKMFVSTVCWMNDLAYFCHRKNRRVLLVSSSNLNVNALSRSHVSINFYSQNIF